MTCKKMCTRIIVFICPALLSVSPSESVTEEEEEGQKEKKEETRDTENSKEKAVSGLHTLIRGV